jgi:hypothetical protein
MTVSNPNPDPRRVKEQQDEERRRTGQKPAKGDRDTPEPTQPPAPPLESVPGHEEGAR